MKKHRKILVCILIALCFCFLCASPAFAITEDEVQQQVDSVGKEAVSGNIFIWFLCAIAFLKASQKIDSFMSSLGINVGHTGGSMLAEAMLATRGISALKGGVGGMAGHFSGAGGGGGSGAGGGGSGGMGGFMAGGLAGAVGRHFSQSAANSVTGQGGGVAAGISRKMFNSSLSKGGEFANQVTGAVARGRVATTGSMSGSTAAAAMSSYFGIGQQQGGTSGGGYSEGGAADGGYSGGVDGSDIGSEGTVDMHSPGGEQFSGGAAPDFSGGEVPDIDSIPTFSDVEIGGGHVTGRETSVSEPGGIDFAMYSMDQYSKPQGDFSVVQAVDGSKWYKQYAMDTVDRTPYMDEEGEIKFSEKIIKAVPRPPVRKDRL